MASFSNKSTVTLLFLAVLALLSIFYFPVWSYFIAGDDIYHLVRAPNNVQAAFTFFTQIQQYRPITHNFFAIYRALPWSIPLFHTISVVLLSSTLTTFILWLKKAWKVSTLSALVGATTVALHHVSFYLVYTLSGVGDLLFLQFFWLSAYWYEHFLQSSPSKTKTIWQNKPFLLSFLFFILTIFTKEIFITLPMFIIARSLLFQTNRVKELLSPPVLYEKIKSFSIVFMAFILPTLLFYVIKITNYQSTEAAYSYNVNPNTLLANSKHFLLWLLSYQHGWQMGMPVPVGNWFPALVMVLFLVLIASSTAAAIYKFKRFLLAVTIIIASLLPFLFLQRVLVFYLDVALFAVAMLYAAAFDLLQKRLSNKIYFPILIAFLVMLAAITKTIEKQWLTYSFVGRSVTAAKNFESQVINKVNWDNNSIVCLSGLSGDAAWAIDDGRMVELYTDQKISIIHADDVAQCNSNQVIIQVNGDQFKLENYKL